jgi:histidinol-phosphate aminotransferase
LPSAPRAEIKGLSQSVHGGPDHAELKALGFSPQQVMDFSVCCNPYPPPSAVRRAMSSLDICRYPDTSSARLRQKLADMLGIPEDRILAGSGTTELIRLIALAYISPGDEVLILAPTYAEYELTCRISGAGINRSTDAPANDIYPAGSVLTALRHRSFKALFLCNPNNPTGSYFSRLEIESILDQAGDSLLVLDEAYTSFVAGAWSALDLLDRGNVILLRSMTKDYGLAGLRLGYALASDEIMRNLTLVCPPWNVNIAAQQAGLAVLDSGDYLERSLARISRAKNYLVSELEKIGLKPQPSRANFFLIETGSGQHWRKVLLKHGILVRDCASFGLPGYVRIAPRTMAECRRFIKTIRQLRQEGEI